MMKTRPPCLEWREKLALRHEDLSPAEQKALDAHVQSCEVCAAALADYHFFEARLDALPPPAIKPLPRLSPHFFEQHSARTQAGRRSTTPAPGKLPLPERAPKKNPLWRVLSVAVVASLLLGAGLLFRMVYIASVAAHPGAGTRLNLNQHAGAVFGVAWSPNGSYIATASEDHTVKVWNAQNGELICAYTGHTDAVYALAWSPNSELIASGGGDDTVQIWNAQNCSAASGYATHTESNPIESIAWSHNGLEIVSGGWGKTAQLWSVTSGKVQWNLPVGEVVSSLSWSPHDDQIAIGAWDGSVHIVNAQSGIQRNEMDFTNNQAVNAVAWSPNGTYLAIGDDENRVRVVNERNGQVVLTYTGHTARVTAVAWSPDGQEIASGSDDKTVQVWHAFTGKLLMTYTGHTNTISSIAWSPNGQEIVSGSFDFTAKVWKVTR